jgi:hypothetical protein
MVYVLKQFKTKNIKKNKWFLDFKDCKFILLISLVN